ncbi:cAMP and cAMP-inhibited cGMP 3',5'-cyclic phosphodiesterase 10A-like [Antedon mediterranea]|uniref:cAMP and cAMP-inhibited cGMP 3',5'-cyclic phosphodiesterase 10A-like n=1 Tax=Antedon mediterranea TaxID=105859 RepID=UPI003AF85700
MSCPWRQVSWRRLPAFPGNSSTVSLRRSAGCQRKSPAKSVQCSVPELREVTIEENVTPQAIKEYLLHHPWLVREFVEEKVTAEEVQQWLIKKQPNNLEEPCEGKLKKVPSDMNLFTLGSSKCGLPSTMLSMVKDIEDNVEIAEKLNKVAKVIAKGCNADVYTLYLVNSMGNDIFFCKENKEGKIDQIVNGPIAYGQTISSYVAYSKEIVMESDILGDERFPMGTGMDECQTKSFLVLPILQPDGEIIGVLELSRNQNSKMFSEENKQVACMYLSWVGIAIHKVQVCKGLVKQREFNDFLLEVSRVIFDDIVATDSLTEHIMMFTKSLVSADRCALFLLDEDNDELYVDLFDEGLEIDGKPVFARKNQIRFSIEKGIAGHVARTGEVVNIPDAYSDSRFNREVDLKTGYTTKNILCMPILSQGTVIGVVQMLNKKGAEMAFSSTDESNFRMFAVYCALALHYSKIYSTIQQSDCMLAVTTEQVAYHITASTSQHSRLMARPLPKVIPPDVDEFHFDIRPYTNIFPELFIYMTFELFGEETFDLPSLARFILTVRNSYRLVPYHNFEHAFTVTHCMYCLLHVTQGLFSEIEMQSLFFACICHDLDHRGFTNSFNVKFDTPLANLYATSTMEQHHFNQTVFILQLEGHNIFQHLPNNVYKQMLGHIRHNILATDLAIHFDNQKELAKICLTDNLCISNPKHRANLHSLLMTASDLSLSAKYWPVQRETVDFIYEEFYQQGDVEREHGCEPLPMMNRGLKDKLAQEQVNFYKFICIPCYTTLHQVLPITQSLLESTKDNYLQWERAMLGKSTLMWSVDSSRTKENQ